MLLKNSQKHFFIALITLFLPWSGYCAECEIKVFECGQGNTVVAKYRGECIAFDAGQSSYVPSVKYAEGQDQSSNAGNTYTIERTGRWICRHVEEVVSLDKVEEWDKSEALETLKKNYKDFTGGLVKTVTISHPHKDHYSLFEDLKLHEAQYVVLGGKWPSRKGPVNVKDLRNKGKLLEYENDLWKFKERTNGKQPSLEVLAVDVSEDNLRRNANVDSMIIKLTHSGNSMLFTGDAELATWKFMKQNCKAEMKSTVLILSHHGSFKNGCTSEDVLNCVQPTICIISAGFQYGHPDATVIEICKEYYRLRPQFRTAVHFVSYCIGNEIHAIQTNFPIFTTLDSGSMTINLTNLSVTTSRGLVLSDLTSFFSDEGDEAVLTYNKHLPPLKDVDIFEKYSKGNVIDIEKRRFSKVNPTYKFKDDYYYRVGNRYFPQILKAIINENSAESEEDKDDEESF